MVPTGIPPPEKQLLLMLLLYYDMTTLLELDDCERWCILQSIILCD